MAYEPIDNSKNLGWAATILAALLGFYVGSVLAVVAAGAALGLAKFAEDTAFFAMQAKMPEDYQGYLRLRDWLAWAATVAVVVSYVLSLLKSWG